MFVLAMAKLSVRHKHALVVMRKNGDSQEHQTF